MYIRVELVQEAVISFHQVSCFSDNLHQTSWPWANTLTSTTSCIKPTYSGRVHVSTKPASWLGGRKAVDKLVGGAALIFGHVLQVDGLLQKDLPLDAGPVVPLNGVDNLDKEERGKMSRLSKISH